MASTISPPILAPATALANDRLTDAGENTFLDGLPPATFVVDATNRARQNLQLFSLDFARLITGLSGTGGADPRVNRLNQNAGARAYNASLPDRTTPIRNLVEIATGTPIALLTATVNNVTTNLNIQGVEAISASIANSKTILVALGWNTEDLPDGTAGTAVYQDATAQSAAYRRMLRVAIGLTPYAPVGV